MCHFDLPSTDTRYETEFSRPAALFPLSFDLFQVQSIYTLGPTNRLYVPVRVTCFVTTQNQVSTPSGIESKQDAVGLPLMLHPEFLHVRLA